MSYDRKNRGRFRSKFFRWRIRPALRYEVTKRLLVELANWLNCAGDKGHVKAKIRELINLCRELGALNDDPTTAEKTLKEFQWKVNERLRSHKARAVVRASGSDYGMSTDWAPLNRSGASIDAFNSITTVLGAVNDDLLHTLRNCVCGAYFVARSSASRFCSPKCRIDFWENSEERKAEKRKNAREYYSIHKNKNVK